MRSCLFSYLKPNTAVYKQVLSSTSHDFKFEVSQVSAYLRHLQPDVVSVAATRIYIGCLNTTLCRFTLGMDTSPMCGHWIMHADSWPLSVQPPFFDLHVRHLPSIDWELPLTRQHQLPSDEVNHRKVSSVSFAVHPPSRPQPDYASVAATRLNVGRRNQTARRLPASAGWAGLPCIFFLGGGLNHISWRILDPGNTHGGVIILISFDPTAILNYFLTTFLQASFIYVR